MIFNLYFTCILIYIRILKLKIRMQIIHFIINKFYLLQKHFLELKKLLKLPIFNILYLASTCRFQSLFINLKGYL